MIKKLCIRIKKILKNYIKNISWIFLSQTIFFLWKFAVYVKMIFSFPKKLIIRIFLEFCFSNYIFYFRFTLYVFPYKIIFSI